jgi:precorrin-6B methylase 1
MVFFISAYLKQVNIPPGVSSFTLSNAEVKVMKSVREIQIFSSHGSEIKPRALSTLNKCSPLSNIPTPEVPVLMKLHNDYEL